jgi:hypothetical protein
MRALAEVIDLLRLLHLGAAVRAARLVRRWCRAGLGERTPRTQQQTHQHRPHAGDYFIDRTGSRRRGFRALPPGGSQISAPP